MLYFLLLCFISIIFSGCGKEKTPVEPIAPIVEKPIIKVSSKAMDFGSQEREKEKSLELNVQNTGKANLEITNISITNDAEDNIFYLANKFEKITLASNGKTTIAINFQPLKIVKYTGSITIESNDTDNSTLKITCKGEGVEATLPKIEVSPLTLTFIDVLVEEPYTNSSTVSFEISNTGTAALEITSVTSSNQEVFKLDYTGGSIEIEGKKLVNVIFQPQTLGEFKADISIESNDVSKTITCIGEGVKKAEPKINVTPLELAFIDVVVVEPYSNSRQASFKISNTGTAALEITSVTSSNQELFKLDYRCIRL